MDMNIQMPKGYRLLANYKNLIVLAEAENNETPEPFVTWLVVNGSDVQVGKYFVNLEKAQDSFCQRAFGLAPTKKFTCKQVVSRHGIRCAGQWIAPADLLLYHLGETVRVTAHGVYSLDGKDICNCDISRDALKKTFIRRVKERNQQLRQHFNDRP